MGKFDWKGVVATVAPKLASAYGGPFAGMAVKKIATALGLNPEEPSLEKKISERLENASDLDLVALKECEAKFEVQMEELGIKEADLFLKDAQNARKHFSESKEPIFIFLILTGVVSLGTWYLIENATALDATIFGMVLTIFGQVVGKWIDSISYFVGTTKSSQEKTSLIAKGG